MSRSTSPLTNGQLLERVASAQGRTRSGRVVFLKFFGCVHISRRRCARRSGTSQLNRMVPIELQRCCVEQQQLDTPLTDRIVAGVRNSQTAGSRFFADDVWSKRVVATDQRGLTGGRPAVLVTRRPYGVVRLKMARRLGPAMTAVAGCSADRRCHCRRSFFWVACNAGVLGGHSQWWEAFRSSSSGSVASSWSTAVMSAGMR